MMEDPPFATHPHGNSKRMYGGGSSSGSGFDADVMEIPPPPTWKSSRRLKHNSTVGHEVIVVDDEDPDDIVIIDEIVAPSSKGKKPMLNYPDVHKMTAKGGVSFLEANNYVKGNSSAHVTLIDDDFSVTDLTDAVYNDECAMLQAQFDTMDIPTGIEASIPWWPVSAGNGKLPVTSSSSYPLNMQTFSGIGSSKVDQFQPWMPIPPLPVQTSAFKSSYYEPQLPYFGVPHSSTSHVQINGGILTMPQWPPAPHELAKKKYNPQPIMRYHDNSINLDDGISAQITPPSIDGEGDASENQLLKKLEVFKKFDTLEDHSDHHYDKQKESYKQSKSWVNKIADEWRMLEKDLPDTIFIRVYESRMDLLRAVIVGAEGTPYHDGLFFFDVCFTSAYPNSPPQVNYRSHGLRINPNLYNDGKVCLSLLGTWSGSGAENWRPGKSNMLQVLVSIQGLILNAEPYYNEPGYAGSRNSPHGKKSSKTYSENTLLLSLKTMLYTLRNPPKYFEDLVFGHFYKHAHDILAACRAYLDGVEVGSFVKGKSQDPKNTGKTCSQLLKMNLPTYIKSLVEAFTKIGVKDCEKYIAPASNDANESTSGSRSTRKRRKY